MRIAAVDDGGAQGGVEHFAALKRVVKIAQTQHDNCLTRQS